MASRIGAASYVECSSVSDCGIDDLKGDVIMASQMGMETKCSKQTKCCSCKIIRKHMYSESIPRFHKNWN